MINKLTLVNPSEILCFFYCCITNLGTSYNIHLLSHRFRRPDAGHSLIGSSAQRFASILYSHLRLNQGRLIFEVLSG